MLEQQTGVYDNPYKFNAKELDRETGLYYYGARYYNPRASIWYGVDPLAIYNPARETQFYGDGEHNGGVFYWGNLNPYIYTYQNPIRFVDPNGKQVDTSERREFIPTTQPRYIPLNPPSSAPRPDLVTESAPRGFLGGLGALGTRLLVGGFLLWPGTLNAPQPKYTPNLPNTPSDDNNDGITLYRGVSSDYRTVTKRDMYNNAKFGVAIPLGEEGGHDDPDLHAKGNNNSIYTSWTKDKKVADKFARGSNGKYPGIILSKKFKFGEAFPNTSPTAQKLNEGEWLVPGIVTGANVEKVKK